MANPVMYLGMLLSVVVSGEHYGYQEKFIEMPLDHFSFVNTQTFQLRYLVNNTFWEINGPIFFYTGNEGDINVFAQNTGFMWEIAKAFGAVLIFAEHRYYGASLPFGGDYSSNPENLGYLTTSQALADYVYLIDCIQQFKMRITHSIKIPVVAFGGSYGGMLAAWLRMKYPNTVVGAIASSAPILQFHGLTSCSAFNQLTTSIFKASCPSDCTELIKKSWNLIRIMGTTAAGRTWLSVNWNLCNPLKSMRDVDYLIVWLETAYGSLAMLNYPYETNFITPLPAYPVTAVCELLQDSSLDGTMLLLALKGVFSIFSNYTGTSECIDVSGTSVGVSLPWEFQVCSELIMPSCSISKDMFENKLWNFTNYAIRCYEKIHFQPKRSDLILLEYGGQEALQYASNIVFSNGLLDPWLSGGVLTTPSKSVVSFLIPGAAHHLDLRATHPDDPIGVRTARSVHIKAILQWIKAFYTKQFHKYYH